MVSQPNPLMNDAGPQELHDALRHMALVGAHEQVSMTALSGGVSSDIYRVDLPSGVVCVKRALPKLKVAADWRAPIERSRWEVEWMRVAGAIVPSAVPRILGEDRATGCFAMAYLPPERYPIWKALLRDGAIEPATAERVGAVLGQIHAATADHDPIAARFRTDEIFYAIRLEPYLVATAKAHPDLAARIGALVTRTGATKRVLVHGDFSPKNLLIGPEGPVILDAECAWYGDPAFDLAFVLTHLLLKGIWRRAQRSRYLECFGTLVQTYAQHVAWEAWDDVEARTAALLPGLLLGRVDGKSPVEYLTDTADKNRVRAFARAWLSQQASSLAAIAAAWAEEGR